MNANQSALIFSIQTMQVMDGKALRAMQPDDSGWYRDVPLGLIGAPSRNRAVYEPNSVAQCMSNPASAFYKKITEGNLRGEYGHPFIRDKSDMMRILTIDMTKVSHSIGKVYTKPTENGNFIVIFGDIKPSGPYGKYLEKSFQDPTDNTSFSLRSICSKPREADNLLYKKMLAMVTFDAVDGPGYKEASKRYVGMESQLSLSDAIKSEQVTEMLGLESNSAEELFDLLQTDSVKVNNIGAVVYDDDSKSLITPKGKQSVFNTFFGGN